MLIIRNTPFAILLAVFITTIFSACDAVDKGHIIGQWKAVSVEEDGEELAIDPAEIKFVFGSDDSYQYFSTLNYREAGSYYVEGNYLYTTDTLNQGSMEKAVEIIEMSTDSLHLKMDDQGKERILKLGKTK